MPKRSARTEECPNCGAEFPAGRLACPECGSDANTGWKSGEEIDYQAVSLPDDDPVAAPPMRNRTLFWVALVAALLGALVLAL
jgi:hypothetical protein